MKRELDHLVVAARTLDEGAAWLRAQLGVELSPGGKHPVMATHNRLLFIGPGKFLELIAVDPDAQPPQRPRWFDLDDPAMRAALERSPALIHWAERTDDLQAALAEYPQPVEVLALERGRHRWRIAVPGDGRRPGGGTLPTLLQWDHGPHPSEILPDTGVRLASFTHEGGRLTATFETPTGPRTLG